MSDYIYPLATVVLDFFCVVFCIRLTASRRGPVWLIPMLLSISLMVGSAVCLIATASDIAGEQLSQVASNVAIFILVVSVIWLMTIIAFAQRTKPDRVVAEDLKALNEAEYIKKHTAVRYRIYADRRPTATHRIRRTDSLEIARKAMEQKTSLYEQGPVSTVSVKKTSFASQE